MSLMNGAGGGGRVACVGIGEEGIREANVGIVRRISGIAMGNYNCQNKKSNGVMDENIEGKQW